MVLVSFESRGPKRSCENVTGRGEACGEAVVALPRNTAIWPVNCSSSRWSIRFLASRSARRISRSWLRRSIACFWASRASTSMRLRSRDDCAARRLRRTRSTRRCSFSSSVLARFLSLISIYFIDVRDKMYLGGRLVLGSGSCWPQDLRFLTGFFSGAGVPSTETLPRTESPNRLDSSSHGGVIHSVAWRESCGGKRGG